MKKVLIAGGGGYIGTLLSKELVERNHFVEVVDLFWFGNHLIPQVKSNQKNIIDIHTENLKDFDTVVFLGGLSNDPMAKYSPAMNFVENAAVPSYLAFIAKEAGIKRFVYASTCSVYGYTNNKLMDEDTNLTFPSFPYGISKLAAEKAIMNMESDSFRPIALRKGTVGGWSPRMRFDLVVNAMTKSALTTGVITVNNPNIWRPLVDVRDVCTAYTRAIESSLDVAGVYNVSYDNYTIGRLADEIRDELRERGHKVQMVIDSVEDSRNYKVSTEKAKTELDFTAKYTPRDSVAAILDNLPDDLDFNNEQYYNIKTFKGLFNDT